MSWETDLQGLTDSFVCVSAVTAAVFAAATGNPDFSNRISRVFVLAPRVTVVN